MRQMQAAAALTLAHLSLTFSFIGSSLGRFSWLEGADRCPPGLTRRDRREREPSFSWNCATRLAKAATNHRGRRRMDRHAQLQCSVRSGSTRTVVIVGGLHSGLALACSIAVIHEWTDPDDPVGTEGVDGVYGRAGASRRWTPCGVRTDQLHVDALCALTGGRQFDVGGHYRTPRGAAGKLQAFGERMAGRIRQP